MFHGPNFFKTRVRRGVIALMIAPPSQSTIALSDGSLKSLHRNGNVIKSLRGPKSLPKRA